MESIIIYDGDPINIAGVVTDVNCHGFFTGSIDITVTDGVPAYSYSWSSGEATEDISGKPAGNYTVIVTDSRGCTATETFTITVTTTVVDDTCAQGLGSASVSVAGGTPPYFYYWSIVASTSSAITGVFPNNYQYTVTDNKGCQRFGNANVGNVTTGMQLNVTTTDAICAGNSGTARWCSSFHLCMEQ